MVVLDISCPKLSCLECKLAKVNAQKVYYCAVTNLTITSNRYRTPSCPIVKEYEEPIPTNTQEEEMLEETQN